MADTVALVKKEESKLPKRTRAVVAKELRKIEADKGYLEPKDVLDEAKDPASPLHKYFNWNNDDAAERFRLMQARVLISTVKVEFLGANQRAYISATVEIEKKPVRGYFSVERVATEEQLYKEVLRKAAEDLKRVAQKYNKLKEIGEILNLGKIDEILEGEKEHV